MEAAPSNITKHYWNLGVSQVTNATGTSVGTGKSNTDNIVNVVGTGVYAAKECRNYNGGGYNDWFLPSLGEFNLMYYNLMANGIGDFPPYIGTLYWTSTEVNASNAYMQQIYGAYDPAGLNTAKYGGNTLSVRPVRSY